MRILLFIIFLLLSSKSFAAGSWANGGSGLNSAQCAFHASGKPYKLLNAVNGFGTCYYLISGTACDSPQVWDQPSQSCGTPGQNGCPSTGYTGAGCTDSNGCTPDQYFAGGTCVNKPAKDIRERCQAAGNGSPVTITVPSGGGAPTCSIGTTGFNGTSTNCQTAPNGTACVSPQNGTQPPGSQCGSMNGNYICVSSSETSAVGTSTKETGSATITGQVKTIEEQVSENGFTTTTTTSTTPQTTSSTSSNSSAPMAAGESLDPGAGPNPVPPYTCSDGKKSANAQSCDTSITCPADSYVAYGVCIKMPTRTTETVKDITTTTTVVRDPSGNIVSQTQSNSSTSTPVRTGSAPQDQHKGQCDPTSKDYQQCVGLLSSVSDTEKQSITSSVETATDTGLTTWNTEQKNSVQGNSNGLGVSTSVLDTMLNPFKITGQACISFNVNFLKVTRTLDCTKFEFFKRLFGWALYMYTIYYIFMLLMRPVER